MEQLASILGDDLSVSLQIRENHGRDESPYRTQPPDVVVFPQTTQQVAKIAGLCNEYQVPLIAYGAGSSLEGQLLAVEGGVSLDLSQMNAIIAVNSEDLTATVQAGVTRIQLNEEIRTSGLFFPVDPGAEASIGGMAATRASGTNAVRYGTMRENVVSLTFVTALGEIVRTSGRARKSSAGYDLTRLLIGSEGTLGIITEVTVRLYPLPEAVLAAVCNFPSLEGAVKSVIEIIQVGVPIAKVEFLNDTAVKAVNRYSKLNLHESPMLMFEFHGSLTGVQEQVEVVRAVANENGGREFEWADKPEDRSRLWTARHNAYFAGLQLRPGCRASTTDVCVPISELAKCVADTVSDLEQASFPYTIVGHVGDGNFHVQMLLDEYNEEQWRESEALARKLALRAIAADGTCTGEHGIGLHKMEILTKEFSSEALNLMANIKRAFDPRNILNPGKIFRLSV
ncbi:FAD-binding oxidoreductase [Klebsiella pneumoniae]|uniref:FAD-binding oxidoreductase n=2 Tax=Pseudomonadota TaxID=1224 RepID=UPI003970C945